MAQLSNTTDQSGLVQQVEKWCRLPYGSSGDFLKEIINNLNVAFEDILPLLLAYNDQIRWDDFKHTDAPIGRVNLVANQNDYKITTDDNSLDILNITHVRIFPNATETTTRHELKRITSDDSRVPEILSPDTDVTGVPSGFVELGNILYLDTLPNYSSTDGIEIFFQRQQAYFTVTGTSGDDTTEPGIPLPFHELLALYASQTYVSINRPEDVGTLSILQGRINKKESDLRTFINLRNPTQIHMTTEGVIYE